MSVAINDLGGSTTTDTGSANVNPNAPTIACVVGQPVNGGTVELKGIGEAGDTVTLYTGSTPVGSGTVANDGTFDITASATFADGVYQFTATETDSANLTSAPSSPLAVDVAPNAPTITGVIGQPFDGGTIEFTGLGEAGDAVLLYEGHTFVGSGMVADDGAFDVTTVTGFVDGAHSFTATQTDGSGITSEQSGQFAVTVDFSIGQISAIFESVLQRGPTTVELADAVGLDATAGDEATISSVVGSPEAQQNVYPIVQIIRLATGEFPTAPQMAGWVPYIESNGLLQGQSQTTPLLDQMALAFVASDNF